MALVTLTQRIHAGGLGEIAPGVQVDLPLALCEALVGSGSARWVLTPAQRSVMAAFPYLSSTADRATNNANFQAMVADMDPGQAMELPRSEYQLDLVYNKGVRVLGAGQPACNGLTMTGGTIIRGEVNVQGAAGAEVGYLGINQIGLPTASYPNGILAGLATTDSTTVVNQYFHDITMLGRGFTGTGGNSAHGLLAQNGRGYLVERCVAWNYLNAFIARCSGATFKNSAGYDADQNAFLIKSASAGGANDAFDNVVDTCFGLCSGAAGAAKGGSSFTVLSEDGAARACVNNRIVNSTSRATGGGQAGFAVQGSGTANGLLDTLIGYCNSYNSGFGAFDIINAFANFVRLVGCHSVNPGAWGYSSAIGAANVAIASACTFVGNGGNGGATNWKSLELNGVKVV